MHQQQNPEEQHNEYKHTAWDEYRDWNREFWENMERRHSRQQNQKSSKTYDNTSSRFERLIDILQRSAAYRPPAIFYVYAAVVFIIYTGASSVFTVFYIYGTSR